MLTRTHHDDDRDRAYTVDHSPPSVEAVLLYNEITVAPSPLQYMNDIHMI